MALQRRYRTLSAALLVLAGIAVLIGTPHLLNAPSRRRSARPKSATVRVRTVISRLSSVVIAAILVFGLLPATAHAATTTTTTLEVASDSIEIPSGELSGTLLVTANVVPAPQLFNGFIPAVGFLVDGTLNGTAPLDENGNGSTDVHLSVGTHSIVATFGGLGDFEGSESDPATVVAKFATAVTLSSSPNPALNTQSVTITASVSPGSITGGTLTVVDSFDGSSIASAVVGSGTTSVGVTQVFATGSHALTATYSGDGDYAPSEAYLTQTINADTWGPVVPITDSGRAAAWAGGLSVTGTDGVQIAYRELVNGSPQVFTRRSTDGGATWELPTRHSGPGGTAPSLASNGSNVGLVWRQHASDGTVKIKYRRSTDGGSSWTTPVTLATLPGDGFPIPRVARDGTGRVAVAWTNTTSGKVFVKVSTDGGVSFARGVSVGVTTSRPWEDAPASLEAFPALAVAGGKIHVAFYTSPARLQLRRSSNSGASWSIAQTLATNGSGWMPSVAAAGEAVVIGYAIYTGGDTWSVVRRSGDRGLTWSSPKVLASRTSNPSFQPIITVRGGVWRALFERCTSADCSGSAVLVRESFNNGLSWGTAFRVSPAAAQYASPIGAETSAGQALVAYQSFDPVTEDTNVAVRTQTGN